MPLTVEDFKKETVSYKYKNYRILIYKHEFEDYWVCSIRKNNEKIYFGKGYHDEDVALSDAKRVIRDKEYQPKFKRGDMIKVQGLIDPIKIILDVIPTNIDYAYNITEQIPGGIKEIVETKYIDKKAEKVGEITDMSILGGE